MIRLCWWKHAWQVYQHCVRADDDERIGIVIAWKQCPKCGASKLIHILR